jgi:hypothetical protein
MSRRAGRAPKTDLPPADGAAAPTGGRASDEDWGLRWALLGILAVVAWLVLCLALR